MRNNKENSVWNLLIFDYGGTLMFEPDFEPTNGNKAIYPIYP